MATTEGDFLVGEWSGRGVVFKNRRERRLDFEDKLVVGEGKKEVGR